MSRETRPFSDIRRVAILGAGNAGLTAAKYLLAEKCFSQIDIFEQRDSVGGLWKYASENDREDSFRIPQTSADAPHEVPIWRADANGVVSNGDHINGHTAHKRPTFVSPMYERLEANLPKMIMQHVNMPFPETDQLFPTHQQTQQYLERYGHDVQDLIHFRTQIRKIEPLASNETIKWRVATRKLGSTDEKEQSYDAVVVASGHFNVPFVPDIPGAKEWSEIHPDSISHSKFFRRPEEYSGKKTLLIGRGSSGLDIASQIAGHCASPLLISTRDSTGLNYTMQGPYIQQPNVRSLDPTTRSVTFSSGQVEHQVDRILFCTGYLYSYPFFPPGTVEEYFPDAPLISSHDQPHGARPHNLFKYIFYNAAPTLAFLSMPQQIVPFPVVDTQSAVIARAWAGRLDLPSRHEMLKWESETGQTMGEGKKFLWLKPPLDGQYLNGLADWANSASVGRSVGGYLPLDVDQRARSKEAGDLDLNGNSRYEEREGEIVHGKQPARWGAKEFWMRQRIFLIKQAFIGKGEERHLVRTLEELGFDFEKWQKAEASNGS